MSKININFKYSMNNTKNIVINKNKIFYFFKYLIKLDYNIVDKIFIYTDKTNKIINININEDKFYEIKNINNSDEYISDILLTNNINNIRNKSITIYDNQNDDTYIIYFNYVLEDNYIIDNIINSFNIFIKTYIDDNNYRFIEDEEQFINKYYIKTIQYNNKSLLSIFYNNINFPR